MQQSDWTDYYNHGTTMAIASWPGRRGGGSRALRIFDNKPPPQSGPCLLLKRVGLIFGRIRNMYAVYKMHDVISAKRIVFWKFL